MGNVWEWIIVQFSPVPSIAVRSVTQPGAYVDDPVDNARPTSGVLNSSRAKGVEDVFEV